MWQKFLALIVVQLFFCQFIFGQERGVTVQVKQNNGQKQDEVLYRNSYALLIGNSDYSEWNSLPGVERDIPQIEAVLRDKHGFTVEKALNLSKKELLNRIDEFISNYGQDYNNRLLIYYAGHGYTAIMPDNKRVMGFLVMKDAPIVSPVEEALLKTPKNYSEFRLRAISMDDIEKLAKDISTRHALFVFDSCFSGTALYRDNIINVPSEISSEELEQMRGFLTAGNEKQRVRDDSPFRRAFIKGLEGKADSNGDGYILSSELGAFVKREVFLETRNSEMPQSPIFGKQTNFTRGDMVFVTPKKKIDTACKKVESLNSKGDELTKAKKYAQAIVEYNKAISTSPNCAKAYANKGKVLIYQDIKNKKEALIWFDKSLEIDADDSFVLGIRGILFAQTAENSKENLYAIQDLTKALEKIESDDLNTIKAFHFWRGFAYSEEKEYEKAILDFNESIRIDPKYAEAYFYRGNAYLQEFNFKLAVENYSKASELNPNKISYYKQLGYSLMFLSVIEKNKDSFNLAIKNFTKVLDFEPEDVDTLGYRAKVYVQIEEFDKAIADYTKIIRLKPTVTGYFTDRAKIYLINKTDYKLALADYDRVIELEPNEPSGYHNRSVAYFSKAMSEKDRNGVYKAIAEMTKAIEMGSGNSESYNLRAMFYDAVGEKEKAAADRIKVEEIKKKEQP